MKNTFRTMMLAAAGVLGSAAVAQAQPAPEPAPGQPAPPAPPPAEFGVAPAALPAAPAPSAPVPTVSWGAQPPPGDTTTSTTTTPEKKQNPFYFTRLTWGNSGGTKLFGIGDSYIGKEDQQYLMSLGLNARYYFVNQPLDKAYVNVNAGFAVELTNSDTTTTKHEVQWNDTVVGIGYGHTVYRNADKTLSLTPGIGASFVLPTSKETRDQGKYLTTSLTASMIAALPIAGPKSDWFSDVFALGAVGWSHTFSKYTQPGTLSDSYVSTIARQAPDGTEYRSDLLSGSMIAHDKVRLNLTYYLTIYKDLSLANTWEILMPTKYPATATDCVKISTGCADSPVPPGASPLNQTGNTAFNPVTTFDLGLSYTLFETARIDVGYTNTSPELDDNLGHRRSIFYGTNAVFYGNVAIYLDTILDKSLNLTESQKKAARATGRFRPAAF